MNQINTTPFLQPGIDPFAKNFISSGDKNLDSLFRFTAEIDKMTCILRQTLLIDGSRRENDAEHSWHLAVMAQIFAEYADEKVDVSHTVKMVVVHDLIEIYAGDTFAYDEEGKKSKEEREKASADKLFALLPERQAAEIRTLWEEFDSCLTADSHFANCLDSLQPFLHNTLTLGHSWQEHRVKKSSVLERQSVIQKYMSKVWPWIVKNVDNAVKNGWLLDE